MKKIIFRFLAYIIDYVIISIVATTVMLVVPVLKEQYDKSVDRSKEVATYYAQYQDAIKEIEKAYKDNVLTKEESTEIYNSYSKHTNVFKIVNEDTKVSEKDLDDIKEKLYDESVENVNKLQYRVEKHTIIQQSVVLGLTVLYLGVIQYFTKGKTLGKKIFRLQVVSDDGKDISLVKYLLRAVLISALIIKVPELICIGTMNYDSFIKANSYIVLLRNIYDMAFIVCIVFRDDQKSIHDVLLHTRVALFDKEGNEVECLMFNDELNKPTEVKEEVKTTTKKPAKKTSKKDKEVVKAEKIDD